MAKNKTAINTVANLASRAWTMIANYVFVPIFIHILGEEAYGLITFFATLQTALNLLGLGLSKTLRREFASDETNGKDSLYKYKILRTVELAYFVISIIICAICFLGAEFIANKYLVVNEIPIETVTLTIRLMGISIASQLLANLYLGCLFGQEKQVLANIIQVSWSIIKNVGVVLVIFIISSEITVFYAWHVLIDIVYMVTLREVVILSLKKKTKLSWSIREFGMIKGIIRFAAGIMIISIGYAINTQADKMIISGNFPLTTVGSYNSAYNLGLVSSIFVAAMGIAVFPRFTNLYTAGRKAKQKNEFVKTNKLANIITATVGSFIAVFSYELLLVWTRSEEIAKTMQFAAFPLIIGTMLNALQEIPYNFFLSRGITIVNNIQTVCSIIYVLTITPIMIANFGIMGASISWLIQMTVFTMAYLILFYVKFFKKEIKKRLLVDTILPIVISLATAVLFRKVFTILNVDALLMIIFAAIAGLATLILLLWLYCRKEMLTMIKKIKRGK